MMDTYTSDKIYFYFHRLGMTKEEITECIYQMQAEFGPDRVDESIIMFSAITFLSKQIRTLKEEIVCMKQGRSS